jgi:hypothetical protein
VPGRLRRCDPAAGDLVRGLLAQPGRDPAPRRQGRHPLGERLARALLVLALALVLDPAQVHRVAGRRTSRGRVTTVSCTRSEAVPQSGQALAAAQAVTTHTSVPPSGAASTPVTCRPCTPSSADAVSSNTMPAAFC